MSKRLKLSHVSHSGRIRPHEYTSYGPLALLLLVVGLSLTIATATAQSPPPQAGSVGLNGSMPGPPPTTAATITSPRNGQRFSTTPVPVTGTCPAGVLVEIFKNDIFAGSGMCGDDGTYTVEIDLLIGQNVLVARVYDSLSQAGPDSEPVTVFYDALPPQADPLSPLNFGAGQMLLSTDAVYRGIFPGQEMKMPISIIGGQPPYAVEVQWGDATNKVIPRDDNQTFYATHTYTKPGTYQITVQATDSQDRVAFITVAAIVNGQPAAAASTGSNGGTANKLLVLWPLYTASLAIVISFWLGEQREKRLLGGVQYK